MNPSEMSRGAAPPSLDPSPEQVTAMGHAAIQVIAEYFGTLPSGPIFSNTSSQAIREQLNQELPIEGQDFDVLLEVIQQVIFPANRHHGHPRFFGYVASPGTAATAIADLLASALNPNVTSWRSAPSPTEVERLTIRWINQIIGYAPEADGLFVSGGSIANLCGLAAARTAKAPPDVSATGYQALHQAMRLYISEECHHSVSKAAGILGIGHNNVRRVAVNRHFQIDTHALAQLIEADLASGHIPFCVVASPGTVKTGACDRLEDVADVAARYGLWFHVDACYGGFAVLAPSKRDLFRGIDRADSVALDPHKWLYAPNDCSCILYRDLAQARATFGLEADYIRVMGHDSDEAFAFWDYGPELTRRFRALKVWMMLSHVGTRALGEAIEHNCQCAQYLAHLVDQSSDFEMMAPVELSVFCFRYIPPAVKTAYAAASPEQRAAIDQDLNVLNERILTNVQRGGNSFLSNASIAGRFALRGCIVNYRTTRRDMEILLNDIRHASQSLHSFG
jgi:glutamate/tyrosine decarboxylase-like PLP-dependent enzyme